MEKYIDLLKEKDKKTVITTVIAFFILFTFIYYAHEVRETHIHHGVKIENIKVSGLSQKEAIKKVEEAKEEENKNAQVTLKLNDKNYFIPFKELGYNVDIEDAVDRAYNVGRTKNPFKNFFVIVGTTVFHKNIELYESFNKESVNIAIDKLEENIYKKPKDANLTIKEKEPIIESEKLGRTLDIKKTKEEINGYLEKREEIELPVIDIQPKIYKHDFNGIDTLLSEFSTKYSASIANRKENIAIGASFFDGILVKPDMEVSFNETVGDINEDRGFKSAGVIINGELDSGIGGGICQVSTTLYNAIIRADLDVVERINHTRPVNYVPLGTDAAVVSGYKDLKFKNSSKYPVYIKSYADGDNLEFKIFGNKELKKYDINIVPKLVSVNNPREIKQYSTNIPVGRTDVKKSGAKGYYYETYREFVENGEIVKSEKLSNSNYIAKDRVVVIGEGDPDEIRERKLAKEKRAKEQKQEKLSMN